MLPYWFSAMTMKSVGKAALAMVEEVRHAKRCTFCGDTGRLAGSRQSAHAAAAKSEAARARALLCCVRCGLTPPPPPPPAGAPPVQHDFGPDGGHGAPRLPRVRGHLDLVLAERDGAARRAGDADAHRRRRALRHPGAGQGGREGGRVRPPASSAVGARAWSAQIALARRTCTLCAPGPGTSTRELTCERAQRLGQPSCAHCCLPLTRAEWRCV